jgi:hypothetical protein
MSLNGPIRRIGHCVPVPEVCNSHIRSFVCNYLVPLIFPRLSFICTFLFVIQWTPFVLKLDPSYFVQFAIIKYNVTDRPFILNLNKHQFELQIILLNTKYF